MNDRERTQLELILRSWEDTCARHERLKHEAITGNAVVWFAGYINSLQVSIRTMKAYLRWVQGEIS